MAELKGLPPKHKAVNMNPVWEEDVTEEQFTSPESSTIHSARYLPDQKLLIVCFKFPTGGIKSVYSYANFPLKEWVKWVVADSKGSWFNAHIRHLPYDKVSG